MFKYVAVICALVACTVAKPGLLLQTPLAAPAAIIAAPAPPLLTASSSQVVARNYNGIGVAPVIASAPLIRAVAPVAVPLAAPLVAKYAAYPLAAPIAAPLTSPVFARYAAAPLAAPLTYNAPLQHLHHF
ncbi:calphotin [Drosophila grimshawi]|uniref:GH22595 n=1 Tax=Drosophila grimshawi TaxID=7222 RepID=B4K0X6_DROGR|nr:calphotin [Drosophila grimshawi]EDV90398.1 GH22595 [Drosophila grimshawi]